MRRLAARPPRRRGGLGWMALAIALALASSWWAVRHGPLQPPPDGLVRSAPPSPYLEDRVIRVLDGDTVVGERLGRIRYIGIDTPEMDAPDPDVRAMARYAAAVNRRLVAGKTVQVVTDVQQRDHYGRLLAYVWVDGLFVNAYLVAEGLARTLTVPPNVRFQEQFVALQRRARQQRLGFWGSSTPWAGREP